VAGAAALVLLRARDEIMQVGSGVSVSSG